MRRWIAISFLIGFVLVGGLMSLWIYAEFSDVHQQSYDPTAIMPNILRALGIFALPAGFLAVSFTAIARWSIRNGWWQSTKPKT